MLGLECTGGGTVVRRQLQVQVLVHMLAPSSSLLLIMNCNSSGKV
jgi:hypothetical protein